MLLIPFLETCFRVFSAVDGKIKFCTVRLYTPKSKIENIGYTEDLIISDRLKKESPLILNLSQNVMWYKAPQKVRYGTKNKKNDLLSLNLEVVSNYS